MLSIIDWRIDYRCFNQCEYCYGFTPVPVGSRDEDEVIISKIANSDVTAVNITGGEPMLYPERCIHIIESLARAGKLVYLSTNGYNALAYMDQLRRFISLLGLPLDGFDEETNMSCGRDRNSYSDVIRILQHPLSAEMKIKIGTVVTRKNNRTDNLFAMASLLDQYPVSVWRIYEMLPENRGAVNKDMLMLSSEDRKLLEQVVHEICQTPHRYRIELVTRNMRSDLYFIIRPDGMVILPRDCGDVVEEKVIGSMLSESIRSLESKWINFASRGANMMYQEQRIADIENK